MLELFKEKLSKTPVVTGTDYFTTKNSEISELRADLSSMKLENQKDAMKQIIASMTVGRDVSQLFPDVVKCMRTPSLELKKLIYLYIINYSSAKPDLTILAVNSFHLDAHDAISPLIRALSIRTMGSIRLEKIVCYLCETLSQCLKDEDAYVRKTACICVAKLYCTSPVLVRDYNFINILVDMILDGNALVVANALIALVEISILSGETKFKIKSKNLVRVLAALNETSEWGQIFILEALTYFKAKKEKQAETIIDSVIPRLSHSNPAVVMSAVKIILRFIDLVNNEDEKKGYNKKISNSMMTILTAAPEIQWVLLRSLHAVVQKKPELLNKEFRYFFIQYNDPLYVKIEKLDILYKLSDKTNFENIIQELKIYSILELNEAIALKAIKYLGYISYKNEGSVDVSVECLREILVSNQDLRVGEALIVTRDLMRRYKGKSLELLKYINSGLIDRINFPQAKSALVFIVGEFCQNIKNSTELLQEFIENFKEESADVKLQILTATIKNYLTKPEEGETIIQTILQVGAEETENPDVRDRAYVYWRLLEVEPDIAKEMIYGERLKFDFKEDINMAPELVDDIIKNMTNISAVYHKYGKDLVVKDDMIVLEGDDVMTTEETTDSDSKVSPSKKGKETKQDKTTKETDKDKTVKINKNKINVNDADLLGLGDIIGSNAGTNEPEVKNVNFEIFDLEAFNKSNANSLNIDFKDDSAYISLFDEKGMTTQDTNLSLIPTANGTIGKNIGVCVYTAFHRENEKILFGMQIRNYTDSDLNSFSIEFKPNSFGLILKSSSNLQNIVLAPGKDAIVILEVENNNSNLVKTQPSCPFKLEVVLKNNLDTWQFASPMLMHVLFVESGQMNNQSFVEFFKENNKNSFNSLMSINKESNEEKLTMLFKRNNIFMVAKNNKMDPPTTYFSCSIANVLNVVLEVSFVKDVNLGRTMLNIRIIANMEPIVSLIKECINVIVRR